MSLILTVQVEGQALQTWTVTDEMLASLEQFRLSQTRIVKDVGVTPTYTSVLEMLMTPALDVVKKAIGRFPPKTLATLQAQADAAKLAYDQAQKAAAQTILQPPL